MDFEQDVLAPVRQYLGSRNIRVPSGATWDARQEARGVQLSVKLTANALCQNLQSDLPAAPTFLWCLAYWLEKARGQPVRCRVIVDGDAPTEGDALRHWRRSQFLLHEYRQLLGARFACDPQPSWTWPSAPIINAPKDERQSNEKGGPLSEHNVEVRIVDSPEVLASFRDDVADLARFHRQFPLGLFDGQVSKATAWTPGNGSQVDLWGVSSDDKTLHLFELKTRGNKPLGIIPETFYYGRLLHWVRAGLPDGRQILGDGEGLLAARRAERIICWLIAPQFHPLVYSHNDSPLHCLNGPLEGKGLEFRVLPFDLTDEGAVGWHRQSMWPAPH